MAYTKHTWVDAQGTNLNKFTKTEETSTSVKLTHDPTFSNSPTAFSAAWMNEMEDGIELAASGVFTDDIEARSNYLYFGTKNLTNVDAVYYVESTNTYHLLADAANPTVDGLVGGAALKVQTLSVGAGGVTAPTLTIDNGLSDGGNIVLSSSGFPSWNIDNASGAIRFVESSTVRAQLLSTLFDINVPVDLSTTLTVAGELTVTSTTIRHTGSNVFRIENDNGDLATTQVIDIDFPSISTDLSYLRLFRNTNTSGTRAFQIYKGDGAADITFLVDADTGDTALDGDLSAGGDLTVTGDITGNNTVLGDFTVGGDLALSTTGAKLVNSADDYIGFIGGDLSGIRTEDYVFGIFDNILSTGQKIRVNGGIAFSASGTVYPVSYIQMGSTTLQVFYNSASINPANYDYVVTDGDTTNIYISFAY